MRIINGKVYTMEGDIFEQGYVDFENGKITAVGAAADAPAYDGEIYDAAGKIVWPGLVESHCHVGIHEEGMRQEGRDADESSDPLTPQLHALDAINPYDRGFQKALSVGITSMLVSPGSGNSVNGQIAAIKTFGNDVDKMLIRQPVAMKMAFGENPKDHGKKGKSPVTRMAVAAMLRELLIKTQEYAAKKEKGIDVPFDYKLESMIPVLKGELYAHIHVHRADDILTALRIAREFHLKVDLIHATEGNLVKERIKEDGVMCSMGPSLRAPAKPEAKAKSFQTDVELVKYGCDIAIMTDHPTLTVEALPICAGLACKAGLSYMDAAKAITINAARVGHIADRVGSLAVGKDADIVVFDGDPLELATKPEAIFIEGKRVK